MGHKHLALVYGSRDPAGRKTACGSPRRQIRTCVIGEDNYLSERKEVIRNTPGSTFNMIDATRSMTTVVGYNAMREQVQSFQ